MEGIARLGGAPGKVQEEPREQEGPGRVTELRENRPQVPWPQTSQQGQADGGRDSNHPKSQFPNPTHPISLSSSSCLNPVQTRVSSICR